MTSFAMAALMLLSAGHGPGTSSSATIDSAAAAQRTVRAENPNARVCVRSQDPTGTILTRAVCRTRAEWERNGGLPTNR